MQISSPYSAIITSPIGSIGFTVQNNQLINLDLLASNNVTLKKPGCVLSKEVALQLERYFADPAFTFSLPLALAGTSFQLRVWETMRTINAGAALSYGTVAKHLNSSARAVGNACRRNPIPIIVPCHRIIASAGIGGFNGMRGGEQLAIKKWLLNHEECASL